MPIRRLRFRSKGLAREEGELANFRVQTRPQRLVDGAKLLRAKKNARRARRAIHPDKRSRLAKVSNDFGREGLGKIVWRFRPVDFHSRPPEIVLLMTVSGENSAQAGVNWR